MADNSTDSTTATQTPPAQAAGGTSPAPAPDQASKSGITILRRGDQVIAPPADPPSPEPEPAEPNPQAPTTEPDNTTQAPPADGGSTEPTEGQEPQQPEPDLLTILSEKSQGKITSQEQVLSLVEEVDQLRTQLAERQEIKFPTEQAKQLYEFASKFPGMEMQAAKSFLHVQSLDVNKLDPKEAQFEAFCLKKPHWSREQARAYFDEKYDKTFAELEISNVVRMDHEEETRLAREELLKLQKEFAEAKPSQQAVDQQTPQITPEQFEQLQRDVQEVTKDFAGIKYQFVKNDPKSVVNVQPEKADLQKLQRYLMDPGELLTDLMKECTVNGVFNQQMYRDAVFEIANRKKIHQHLFNQGAVYGKVETVIERKNTATPREPTAPAPVKKPSNPYEALRDKIKAEKGKV